MLDHFLTSILQITIILDILGAIAYFVLGGFRPRTQKEVKSQTLREHRRTLGALWERLPWRLAQPVPASEIEFDQLKSILYSYQEGLA